MEYNFFGAHTQTLKRNWVIKSDKHMAFELILILKGKEVINIEGQSYTLNENDIVIIPPNHLHDLKVSKEHSTSYFCCHFDITDPQFSLALIESSNYQFKSGTKNNENLRNYIDQWIELFSLDDDNFSIKMKELIILANFFICLKSIGSETREIKNVNSSTIKKARQIMEEIKKELNTILYTEKGVGQSVCDIQVSKIIKKFRVTPEHGSVVFKNVYGVTPRKYLTGLILKEANSLLQKPDLSIDEISVILGYSSSSHFSRQFKRWTKMAPKVYRKKFFEKND
ncbi:AraC family transcriptional regulator [Vagococcus fluvialis]|uniref:AraC family transcriptional regulator n=1 Tax=Vagococcus fluvialis TaxID=2738 RepID=UPI003D10C743